MTTGRTAIILFVIALLIISISTFPLVLSITGEDYGISEKALTEQVRDIILDIFKINITNYRLESIELQDIYGGGKYSEEIYMVVFKNNENYAIKTEADVVAGRVIGVVMYSLPAPADVIQNINVRLKLINDKSYMDGKALGMLLNDLARSIRRLYGGLAKPITEALVKASSRIPDALTITKGWNGYTYRINITSEYSLVIQAFYMNGANTPLGFSLSIWKSLTLPFKTKVERGVLNVDYDVASNKTYAYRFEIQPFFADAYVVVPEKIKHISLDRVIETVDQALNNYLHAKGITGYTIESIKPKWITYSQRMDKGHLVIIPGNELTLEAKVRIGHETKYYLVYLDLDSMKATIKENYYYGRTLQYTNSDNEKESPGSPLGLRTAAAIIISIALLLIILFYTKSMMKGRSQ